MSIPLLEGPGRIIHDQTRQRVEYPPQNMQSIQQYEMTAPTSRSWLSHFWNNFKSQTTMVSLFLGATGCAVGHHAYYASLDGTMVVEATSRWDLNGQEWKIRFRTAFAFLVKAMFAGAVVEALNQRLWLTAREKTITVGGLDAMFGVAATPLFLFNSEFLRKAKIGAAMAYLVWCDAQDYFTHYLALGADALTG
ncbi:hypothetical protein OQA88_188 [Cercophora sp. LCS_1]